MHEPEARRWRATWGGSSDQLRSGGKFVNVLRLDSLRDSDEQPPTLKLVQIFGHHPIIGATGLSSGTWDLEAEIHWTTGKARANALVDVPAGGCSFTVCAGDSLEVNVRAIGTNASTAARMQAMACEARGANVVPAQRTIRHDLDTESGTIKRIPSFARAVRFLPSVNGKVGNAVMTFFADEAGLNRIGQAISSGVVQIPLGAHAFSAIDAAGGYILNSIFELCL